MAGESTYTFGYCTWYVAHALSWVKGGWGNAWQWAARASAAGFHLTKTPTVGSVVVYGPGHGYSEYGHVAIVKAVYPLGLFLVSEMAAVAWNVVSSRISNTYNVTAFILPPAAGIGINLGLVLQQATPAADSVAAAWALLANLFNRALPLVSARLAAAAARAERIS